MVLYRIMMSETFGQSVEVSFLGFESGKKKKRLMPCRMQCFIVLYIVINISVEHPIYCHSSTPKGHFILTHVNKQL